MAYITGDGRVLESRPWSLAAFIDMFWGFINVVILFFRTLINPDSTKKGDNASTDYRRPGRPGPGSGPGHGPNVRGFRRGGNNYCTVYSTTNPLKLHHFTISFLSFLGAPSSSPPMAAGG